MGSELPVSLTLIEGRQWMRVSSMSKISSFLFEGGSFMDFWEGFEGISIVLVY